MQMCLNSLPGFQSNFTTVTVKFAWFCGFLLKMLRFTWIGEIANTEFFFWTPTSEYICNHVWRTWIEETWIKSAFILKKTQAPQNIVKVAWFCFSESQNCKILERLRSTEHLFLLRCVQSDMIEDVFVLTNSAPMSCGLPLATSH